uniref:Uncharacterized protein n=1 Tax=Chenopodium quinoa TaxID=63459 RepID=A0A803N911_CHEQI
MAKEADSTGGEIMLFGVRVVVDSLRKSVSLNNLSQYEHCLDSSSSNDVAPPPPAGGVSRERKRELTVDLVLPLLHFFVASPMKSGLCVFGLIPNLRTPKLPTQFYMALLYTVTTLTLTLQSVYYGHIYHRLKSKRQCNKDVMPHQVEVGGEYNVHQNGGVEKQNGNYGHTPISSANQSGATMSSPIPLPGIPRSHSAGQDSFYTSARSLSTSHTPTRRSFAAPWRPSTTVDVEDPIEEPLLGGSLPTRLMHPSKPKNLLCIVPAIIFIVGTLNFTRRDTRLSLAVELPNRKLLQVNGQQKITSGVGEGIGTYMGWAMAVIYMGGRLPQICLNMLQFAAASKFILSAVQEKPPPSLDI